MWTTLFNTILDRQGTDVCNIRTTLSEEVEVIFGAFSSSDDDDDDSSDYGQDSQSILESFDSSIASVDNVLDSLHSSRNIQRMLGSPNNNNNNCAAIQEHNIAASSHSVIIDIDFLQRQQSKKQAITSIQRMARGMIARTILQNEEHGRLVLENKESDDTLDSDIDDSVVFDDDDFLEVHEEEDKGDFTDQFDIQVGNMQDGSSHMDKISIHLRPISSFSTTTTTNAAATAAAAANTTSTLPSNSKKPSNTISRKQKKKKNPMQLYQIQEEEEEEEEEDVAAEPTLHTSNHSNEQERRSQNTPANNNKTTNNNNQKNGDIDVDLFFQDEKRNTRDDPILKHSGKTLSKKKKARETMVEIVTVFEKDFCLQRDVSAITIGPISVSEESIEKSLETNLTPRTITTSTSTASKKWKLWSPRNSSSKKKQPSSFGRRRLSLTPTMSTMEGSFSTAPTLITTTKTKNRFSKFKSLRGGSNYKRVVSTTTTTPLSQITERVIM